MLVKSFEYDLQNGFAWMILDDGLTVQCCLSELPFDPEDDDKQEYEPAIVKHDCGHNWGTCGDINKKPFEKYGENRCMTMLFKKAKQAGLEV